MKVVLMRKSILAFAVISVSLFFSACSSSQKSEHMKCCEENYRICAADCRLASPAAGSNLERTQVSGYEGVSSCEQSCHQRFEECQERVEKEGSCPAWIKKN